MGIERDIAQWYQKFKPLNEFEVQDQKLLRSLTREIATLVKTFARGSETLSIASGFLVTMGLRKLFVIGDDAVKESVRDLLLERLHSDPRFLLSENQEGIQYANAPLFVVLTEVMRFKDLFKYEPHATLLSQLTASVSDTSYWIKEEAPPKQVPVENRAAFFTASNPVSPPVLTASSVGSRKANDDELNRLALERMLGLS